MRFWKLNLHDLRPPELLCFDHLYSEYLTMKIRIKEPEAVTFIDELSAKVNKQDEERRNEEKTNKDTNLVSVVCWKDLYYFELILADYIPVEKLRSKIIRLRSDYQSIACSREYSEYLASKPPDLQSPPEPTDPPHGTQAEYEKLLREDLKDLLGRMYIKYAILPVREKRLTDLTWFAAKLCGVSLGLLLFTLVVIYFGPPLSHIDFSKTMAQNFALFTESTTLSSLTIFVVVISGAMGGFVSALQRIQSPPTEGDSLYNLSLLFHGSKAIFVAPITGAIFAIMLYLMFTAGIFKGTFFPNIYTPSGGGDYVVVDARPADKPTTDDQAKKKSDEVITPNNSDSSTPPQSTAANTNQAQAQNNRNAAVNANGSNANSAVNSANGNSSSANGNTANTANGAASSTPKPTPTPLKADSDAKPIFVARAGMSVFYFLAQSGPVDGGNYALLIIWCFIAGFAERFVPDALDRLVSNSKARDKA